MLKKIVITGGDGRFAQILKKDNNKLDILYPGKKELNILDINSINKYLKKNKPKYLIHAAALSRPMNIHDKEISKSIDLNILAQLILLKFVLILKLNLYIFQLDMFTREKLEIIKKKILFYLLIIMPGPS